MQPRAEYSGRPEPQPLVAGREACFRQETTGDPLEPSRGAMAGPGFFTNRAGRGDGLIPDWPAIPRMLQSGLVRALLSK